MMHENIFVKPENGAEVKWPTPAIGGIKIDNKYMLADAERTAETMHFEGNGEVWIVELTYPNLKPEEYPLIYNSLKPFVVYIRFWNTWTNSEMVLRVYRGDLSITRSWKHINAPITITLTGTETLP